jgi:hypothetical protein
MLVPFMSVVFGYNPVTITFYFVLAATCYFTTLQVGGVMMMAADCTVALANCAGLGF